MIRKATLLLSLIILFSTSLTTINLDPSTLNQFSEGKSVTTPCGGPSNTDSITILPPGPVTLPADQSRIFTATLKDSDGNTLGGSPDWSVSDGSINPQGGGDAIYYPNSVGNHTVWACAADAVASIQVIVTIGATQSIELIGNKNNLTADETIEFLVMERDSRGNTAPLFVPSSGWTIPEGSGLNVLPGFETTTGGFVHQPAVWHPGPIGTFDISVSVDGLQSSWNVNVSRGIGVDLVINIDRTIITSDEIIDLSMSISDVRGNLWPVEGQWSTLAPQAMSWLSNYSGEHTTFDGTLVGNWTVHGEYNGVENGNINMSDEVTIDVRAGRISLVEIEGHDTTMLTGEVLQLTPVATDLDGNIIEDATFNWSVDGASGQESIDENNLTFVPTTKGQHNILAEAGGRPSSIRVQVEWSDPIDLNVTTNDGEWYLTVTTGETLPLHVQGLDVRGEWHTYNPIWEIDANFGSIEESGGDGDYLYRAAGVNWTQLHAFVGENEYTILVFVTPGVLDNIEITVTDRGIQGKSVPFSLRGFDISGNGVAIPVCDVTVTSTAGRTECNDDSWTLHLDNGGEQQVIKATYENANGSGYIDVQPTLLDGQFGSSTQVIAAGALLIALLISVVLIVAYLRVKRLSDEIDENEEYDEEEEEPLSEEPFTPEVTITQNTPLPMMGNSPPMGMNMPAPPPSIMPRTNIGKKRMAPTPPPPSFMFGTGIASNSSSPQPVPGVFVRSESKYGWEDPSHQVTPPGYGWEQIGSTSVGIAAKPNAIEEQNANPPAIEQPKEIDEEMNESPLSNALSMFPDITTEKEKEIDIEEKDLTPTGEESEQENEKEESKDDLENTIIEATESSDNLEWDDDLQNESDESEDGSDWDSWDDEWGGDEENEDKMEEQNEEVGEELEEEIEEEVEDSATLGPRTEDGTVLKALPGTKEGESGWYFDSNGKPSLWEFREVGWERIK